MTKFVQPTSKKQALKAVKIGKFSKNSISSLPSNNKTTNKNKNNNSNKNKLSTSQEFEEQTKNLIERSFSKNRNKILNKKLSKNNFNELYFDTLPSNFQFESLNQTEEKKDNYSIENMIKAEEEYVEKTRQYLLEQQQKNKIDSSKTKFSNRFSALESDDEEEIEEKINNFVIPQGTFQFNTTDPDL